MDLPSGVLHHRLVRERDAPDKWMFVLHGLSTLGLVGLTALHVYFAIRPEKRFYTRSMISGWISEDEHRANHDGGRWSPDQT